MVFAHGGETKSGLTFDDFCTSIGCEDDDGVTEVDLATEVVRDLAFFQDLQKQVHHVWVSFRLRRKSYDAVGAATHGFRKLAAFFIADISRRCSD